jgi:hypothetical protein
LIISNYEKLVFSGDVGDAPASSAGAKRLENLPSKRLFDIGVPRNRFYNSGAGVGPQ